MNVHPKILGCRLNHAEALELARAFGEDVRLVSSEEEADLVVVNTCAVTRTAERKSRKAIRRSLKQGKRVLATGCATRTRIGLPQQQNLTLLPNEAKEAWLAGAGALPYDGSPRAHLKIQDGCLRTCAFCIVPFTRPKLLSRPLEAVVQQARKLVGLGVKEIVLTGASVGLYGLPYEHPRQALPALLSRLCRIEGIERIRLSSFDPRDVSEPFLEVFATEEKICPHLHLTLQSGDNKVLKAMQRGYTAESYLGLIERLRSRKPGLALTTDILVGFPGEDEAAFLNTLGVMKAARFSRCHIFPYSPREGTAAARLRETVPPEQKRARVRQARALARELEAEDLRQKQGRRLRLLVESAAGGQASGYSDEYIRVLAPAGPPPGSLLSVEPVGLFLDHPHFKSGGVYARISAH